MYAPVAANAIRSPGTEVLGHRHVVGEDVARLAVLADHGDGRDPRDRVAGTVRRQRLEAGVVQHGPQVVGHPAVDGHERAAGGVLARTDRVEGDDRVRHERAPGLGHEGRPLEAALGAASLQAGAQGSATSAGSRPGSSTYGTANPPPRSSTRTVADPGVAHAQRQPEQGVERRLVRKRRRAPAIRRGRAGRRTAARGATRRAARPSSARRSAASRTSTPRGRWRSPRASRRGPRERPAAGRAASGPPRARSRRGAGARPDRRRSRARAGHRPRARSSASDLLFPWSTTRSPRAPARRHASTSPPVDASRSRPSSRAIRITACAVNALTA